MLGAPVRVTVRSKDECVSEPQLEEFRCSDGPAAREVALIVGNLLSGEAVPQTVAFVNDAAAGTLLGIASVRPDGNAQLRAKPSTPWFVRRLSTNPYVNMIARDRRFAGYVLSDGRTRLGTAVLRAGLEVLAAELGDSTLPTVWALIRRQNTTSKRTFGEFAFTRAAAVVERRLSESRPLEATFYGEHARHTQLAFFDRHLRERDIASLPPMRLEIRDRADHVVEVRDEQEWPLARTDWRRLYLRADSTLSEQPDGIGGSITFDLRRNAAAFDYRFEQDTELSGPMTLGLQVAVAGNDVHGGSVRSGRRCDERRACNRVERSPRAYHRRPRRRACEAPANRLCWMNPQSPPRLPGP